MKLGPFHNIDSAVIINNVSKVMKSKRLDFMITKALFFLLKLLSSHNLYLLYNTSIARFYLARLFFPFFQSVLVDDETISRFQWRPTSSWIVSQRTTVTQQKSTIFSHQLLSLRFYDKINAYRLNLVLLIVKISQIFEFRKNNWADRCSTA